MDRRKMLVVDDVKLNRMILAELFLDDYEIIEAENGKRALELIDEYSDELAIVLLDIVMPELDGFGVLRSMNENGLIKTIPVIFITGEDDDESAINGFALGVSDMIKKPFNPEIVEKRVSNVATLYNHQYELESRLREQKEMLEKQAERLSQNNLFIIDALSATVEFRSLESGEHVKRVRLITKAVLQAVSKEYDLADADIEAMSNASALHDVGKIAIPDSILLKPGKLTNEEFEIMKTHTTQGCEILNSFGHMQDPEYFTYSYDICRHHHERWDGRGYPDGLKGDETPIWAQATAVADVYDALTSKRVYKDAFVHNLAVDMIVKGECGAFNPKVLDAFMSIRDDLPHILGIPQ